MAPLQSWSNDPIVFATWALTQEGRLALTKRVTQQSSSAEAPSGPFGDRLGDHVLALRRAVESLGCDPKRWGGRFENGALLKLLGHLDGARKLLEAHERLCGELDESAKADVSWGARQARINEFQGRVNLEVNALKEILATAKPPA